MPPTFLLRRGLSPHTSQTFICRDRGFLWLRSECVASHTTHSHQQPCGLIGKGRCVYMKIGRRHRSCPQGPRARSRPLPRIAARIARCRTHGPVCPPHEDGAPSSMQAFVALKELPSWHFDRGLKMWRFPLDLLVAGTSVGDASSLCRFPCCAAIIP